MTDKNATGMPEPKFEFFIYALGILTTFFGAAALILGIVYPMLANMSNASAFQVTQVYTEGSHIILAAIGLLAFSAVCILNRIANKD